MEQSQEPDDMDLEDVNDFEQSQSGQKEDNRNVLGPSRKSQV